MKLNLGSCDRHFEGFTNIDICPPADVIADLTQTWPWADSSVDEIRAYDILEHLPDIRKTMNEAWRVLKPGGIFDIFIPTTEGRGAWQDPTHVSFWNRNTFFYFTDGVPERERFGGHYGITARFKVVSEEMKTYPDNVPKLRIFLAAVKP
jgi:SAM-dependent methyltransferase